MLLETALADFSDDHDSSSSPGRRGALSYDSSSGRSTKSSFNERSHRVLGVRESEDLHLHGDVSYPYRIEKRSSGGGGSHKRMDSGQFYAKEGSVPFKWEAAPGKPMLSQELSLVGCSTPESPRLRPPPALRNIATGSPARSPLHSSSGSSIAGKVKSILSYKLPKNVNSCTTFPQRAASDWCSGSGREQLERDSVDSDDGREESSPVSTLDCPPSPLSPTFSPKHHDPDDIAARENSIDSNGHGNSINRRGGGRPLTHGSAHELRSSLIALTDMAEELPAVMEEDENDLESPSSHNTDYPVYRSPGSIEDRNLSRRVGSSKSLSAPISRQGSALRPGVASTRGRRRSDFDWPEDFEERPEEVVKEVDESLWAYSPVASSFLFSGNEGDRRSPSVRRVANGSCTPSSISSGSVREAHSLRSLGSLSNTKSKNGGGAASSHLRPYSINGDDDFLSVQEHPIKRSSFSCVPFFSLCKTHRPTPTISFSRRLSPESLESQDQKSSVV